MFDRFFEWISEKTEAAIWRGFERVKLKLEKSGDVLALPPPDDAPTDSEPAKKGRKP